jgi:putative endopeptidase
MSSKVPAIVLLLASVTHAGAAVSFTPRFSLDHLDRSVSPRTNFYQFANGSWIRNNAVPADKARWASFNELEQQNWGRLRAILEDAAAHAQSSASHDQGRVGAFYASAIDTNHLESAGFDGLSRDLDRIDGLEDAGQAARLTGDWHRRGIGACFAVYVAPDSRNSGIYALHLYQGGLGLPDREYYLADGFASERGAYRTHIANMLSLLGYDTSTAREEAEWIIQLETQLARASRSRTELRDREKNYNKWSFAELQQKLPDINWADYFAGARIAPPKDVIVGQPEFFTELNRLATEADPEHWLAYLRWHLLRSTAPYLHDAPATESFRFYGTVLQGQPAPEPRWQRAARTIDRGLGEALGKLFVERHFPLEARSRMLQLIADVRAVFRDRLTRLDWMTPETREEALRKFERFTSKIGHPEVFRDYSTVEIRPNDYLGNVQRATAVEFKRRADRVGQPVDRGEWNMTPPTVNAYFNPTQNEIVFPAGILQPPFFDPSMDDAVNYGAIGSIIGHEITHGYDDQGRKYDAEGNLRDWWAPADVANFTSRAHRLVEQYNAFEPLPGAHVNGHLTLGENIADLGGVSLAFEALQRALERDPSKRQSIGGFTPEQRFFLAYAQAWRANAREAEVRRRLVVDSHAPPRYRGFAPLLNLGAFHSAFDIQPGDPMWKEPEDRAKIW